MNIVEVVIHRPRTIQNGIRLYGIVRTADGTAHHVAYIRKSGMRRWVCNCLDFVFHRMGSHQHCECLKAARRQNATVRDLRNLS